MTNNNQPQIQLFRGAFYFSLLVLLFNACSSPRATMGTQAGKKVYHSIRQNDTLKNLRYGLYIIDAETGKELFKKNAHQQFTPASNTKLLTYFIAQSILPDQMPFVDYVVKGDTAILWPYGDPEFLNPALNTPISLIDSLENLAPYLKLSNARFHDKKYGPGWAWDDYNYSFQTEKSFFPAYGNLVTFILRNTSMHTITVYPTYFKNWVTHRPSVAEDSFTVERSPFASAFDYALGPEASANDKVVVPMSSDKYSLGRLLNDTLESNLSIEEIPPSDYRSTSTIYGIATDSLYREMLLESDNHIAEQLLLSCSYVLSDTLKTEIALTYARDSLLTFLPDPYQYIDGSGLSRYNLTTPANLVALLNKLKQNNFARTIAHLPKGGESGTIQQMFQNSPIEIYAKTGSLRNIFNLSGFIICESGRILIFSWMNNNFTIPRSVLKQQMVETLTEIYKSY